MTSDEKISFSLDVDKDGPLNAEHAAQFAQFPHLDDFYIRGKNSFLVSDAKKLEIINSVFSITIWTDTTRAAVRSLIWRPNLKELIIFRLKSYGKLEGFENAQNLEYFSCLYGLNGDDLLEIAKLPKLNKLGAQQAKITEESLLMLLDKPLLTDIDFECSNFNDDFAKLVAPSRTITTLELGATDITNVGLEKICSMKQLEGLDIWATDIGEADIDMLGELPNLKYLSIGGHDEQTTFTPKKTLPKLYKMPALKKVWLDGFRVTEDEWDELNRRFDQVQVTSVKDN